MKALLDTNVFLWALLDDARLSRRVRGIIRDRSNILLLSASSAWELVIKARTGKLKLPDSPGRFILEGMAAFAFGDLPIELRHVLHVETLPDHHRDPFDRILIAQSQLEGLPILTADPIFQRYAVEAIW